MLRHLRTDFAMIAHTVDDIYDFGTLHVGADLVILDEPRHAEEVVLKDQLLPGCHLVEIEGDQIYLKLDGNVVNSVNFNPENHDDKDQKLLSIIEPLLKDLIYKYEF